MTDALAEWTLRRNEEDKHPVEEIATLFDEAATPDTFATWVEERRGRQGLRNDDVTLVIIDL
jgi:hypothetical protein